MAVSGFRFSSGKIKYDSSFQQAGSFLHQDRFTNSPLFKSRLIAIFRKNLKGAFYPLFFSFSRITFPEQQYDSNRTDNFC